MWHLAIGDPSTCCRRSRRSSERASSNVPSAGWIEMAFQAAKPRAWRWDRSVPAGRPADLVPGLSRASDCCAWRLTWNWQAVMVLCEGRAVSCPGRWDRVREFPDGYRRQIPVRLGAQMQRLDRPDESASRPKRHRVSPERPCLVRDRSVCKLPAKPPDAGLGLFGHLALCLQEAFISVPPLIKHKSQRYHHAQATPIPEGAIVSFRRRPATRLRRRASSVPIGSLHFTNTRQNGQPTPTSPTAEDI